MNLKEDIKPISYIKTNAADVIKKINSTHRPIIITQNGEAKGVFIDTESYEEMKNAITLLKLMSQSESDVKRGKVKSDTAVYEVLEKKLKNAQKSA